MVLIGLLSNAANFFGLIDVPSKRKIHRGRVPLVGGIGIYLIIMLMAFNVGLEEDSWAVINAAFFILAI